jgi:hypothetical protein
MRWVWVQGDVVVLQGEVGSEMYFITEGTMAVRVYDDINLKGGTRSPPPRARLRPRLQRWLSCALFCGRPAAIWSRTFDLRWHAIEPCSPSDLQEHVGMLPHSGCTCKTLVSTLQQLLSDNAHCMAVQGSRLGGGTRSVPFGLSISAGCVLLACKWLTLAAML